MTESVPLQSPLIDLQMSSDTAYYVGMLEGTIAALVVNEVKYRTLLELLTGDKWDAADMPTDPKELMLLAVSMVTKQTGISRERAESLVGQRFNGGKPKQVIPQPSANLVVPPPEPIPMSDRFKRWKERQTDLATGGEVTIESAADKQTNNS